LPGFVVERERARRASEQSKVFDIEAL